MKILVLCTGNSARSILLESVLNCESSGRITAFSAGSQPTGTVNSATITTLKAHGLATEHARSKSWSEFSGPDAPKVDLVITVCGNARDETCPIWPGAPTTVHWGVEDPAAVTKPPDAVLAAFDKAYAILHHRACALIALPFEDMSKANLQRRLSDIGDMTP